MGSIGNLTGFENASIYDTFLVAARAVSVPASRVQQEAAIYKIATLSIT